MNILAVSDVIIDWIYSPKLRLLQSGVDLVICCGDLPQYYIEYIVSVLDCQLFLVNGNHSIPSNIMSEERITYTGSQDLHCKVVHYKGYLFAGIEGSLNYNNGQFQYSQAHMWLYVFRIMPSLLLNKYRYGRYLDVMITHAPPSGIHDQPDLAHQGIKAFRWLVYTLQPDYLVHGHIHVYRPDAITETRVGKTVIVNAYGFRNLVLPPKR